MHSRTFITTLLFSLFFLTTLISAASSTSFCKCICGANSTIIPLNGRVAPGPPSSLDSDSRAPTSPRTCNDCNRQFCLSYNLPICKGKEDEEISTMCFQRDSAKDRAVVYTFIVLTVGLLVYAALRPYIDSRVESFQGRGANYAPLSGGLGNT